MISVKVNGKAHRIDVSPDTPLLWVLRDALGLTGTKYGCGIAQCGAGTAHVEGEPTRSCITTIEGLSNAGDHSVQEAWVELDVVQCGYCQSGQIMTAAALLAKNPHPTDAQINDAMSGILCRCGTYQRIRAAIKRAAGMREA